MRDLVGNTKDRLSHDMAHLMIEMYAYFISGGTVVRLNPLWGHTISISCGNLLFMKN